MFFKYSDEKIKYIGRWAPYEDSMTATAVGSRFTVNFKGKKAILHFDTFFNQAPLPHLWLQVDGGAKVEVTLDRYIRIVANGGGVHSVTVTLKSMVEMFPRWNMPLTNKISFLGIEAEELDFVADSGKKIMEIVGDSITEGVLTDPDYSPVPINFAKAPWQLDENNRPWQDDVCATYGWLTAEALGFEPIIMGYGAVGTTRSGCGGVVSAPEAYPYCFSGAPISYPHPDYVLINHGTNDREATVERFTECYRALLDEVFKAHPNTQVICMSPFIGAYRNEIEEIAAQYNKEHGTNILFVNGSEWLPADPLHPARQGHAFAAEKLTEVLRGLLK